MHETDTTREAMTSGPPYYVPYSVPLERMAMIDVDATQTDARAYARAVELLVVKLGRMTPEGTRTDWSTLTIGVSPIHSTPAKLTLFAKVTDHA